MISISKKEIESLSQSTGFLQNQLEKTLRAIQILRDIDGHPFLGASLVLKGGTGLNLFYFDMPRLSLDIDLNYIGTTSKAGSLKDRNEIAAVLSSTFSSDYGIVVAKEDYALNQFEFHYKNASDAKDRINLDINYLLRLPMAAVKRVTLDRLGRSITFTLLGFEELIAAKIITLLSRQTPRDVFDIYCAANLKMGFEPTLLRDLTLFYAIVSRATVVDLFKVDVQRVTRRDILRYLKPLLRRDHYPDRDELITQARDFMLPYIGLSGTAQEAIERFYSGSELDLSALFSRDDIREKVGRSPAFHWKAESIRRRTKRASPA